MPQAKTLAIDFTQEESVLQIYPQVPLLSSKDLSWQGIHLSYYRQPPHETLEYAPKQYLISIHLGQPVTLQQHWQEGNSTKEIQMYGDVSIYPTARSLKETWDADSEFLEIYLMPTLFSQAAGEFVDVDRLEILPQPSIRDPLIQQLGLSLKAELESAVSESSGRVGNRLFAESASTMLAVHLIRQYSSQESIIQDDPNKLPKYKLQVAIEYIQAHLSEDISLEALAQEVGMSMYHFSRLFKRSLGYSPYQYVLKCRVEQAKILLLQRQLNIADVAFTVGFSSQSHFTQHFKRFVGATPKQFLNQ
ncbi:MAG: helix-turn-helix transcriptional regulator [Leptolyngbyaceae cyanobacterium SM1_4_3]|nr:helix-turn-helix transcriptional regulator [Leptolyngbyaceae cyanobacterium SM1_4_3]NJN91952.1 helix-turn-helix transcriptional regulator [Leptolyngbyaceae cyanobacterium SL_5_14]NJO66492.1 helix-turn-helix transcriptional regulator [Leptolyngbyaceae cyanobacterium RM1_405_57]